MGREIEPERMQPDASAPDDVVARLLEVLVALLPEVAERHPDRLASLERIIRSEFAGEEVYIPKRVSADRRAQNLERFNGRNATEVARQLGISRATVYRLLKQPGRR